MFRCTSYCTLARTRHVAFPQRAFYSLVQNTDAVKPYPYFDGKVIAISGAASGMGLATAKLLYPTGALLSLTDSRGNALEEAVQQITSISPHASKENIITTIADVRSSSEVDTWIANTLKKFGRLDGATNFAGSINEEMLPITQMTDEHWRSILDINLNGVFYALRAQLRAMQKSGQASGSIVNAASVAGLVASVCPGDYTVSKFGVVGLTRSAAREAASYGVRVNAIAPGVTQTPLIHKTPEILAAIGQYAQLAPMQRMGKPEEIAKLVAFLLSDESSYTTGAVHVIDGGGLA